MSKHLIIAGATAVALIAGSASAATISSIGTSSGAVSGDGSVTVTLDKFNSALGTLDSVSFTVFTATSAATITIRNDGGTTESSSVKLNSTVSISDPNGALASIFPVGPYSTFDQTGDISLTAGQTSAPQSLDTAVSGGINFLLSPAANSFFTGPGSFSFGFLFDTGFETETGSNFTVSGSSLSNAAVTVEYTYTEAPSTVPLPAALPLLGAGLAGLAFIGRRRKS